MWLGWLVASCSEIPEDLLVIAPPHFGPGTAELRIVVGTAIAVDTLELRLDGEAIRDQTTVFEDGIRVVVELGAGDHEVSARAQLLGDAGSAFVETQLAFSAPPAFAAWVDSIPTDGERAHSRGGWVTLDFAAEVRDQAIASVVFECGGRPQAFDLHRSGPERIVLDPRPELPPATFCRVSWRGEQGPVHLKFSTATIGPPARIEYDRRDPRRLAPFPDDFWLATNPDDPSEQALRIIANGYGLPDQWLMNALARGVRELDGFSPIGHVTIPLSAPAAPDSLPRGYWESLATDATVSLFDVTEHHPDFGTRVPFQIEARSETTVGPTEHALILYPSVALKPRHRYGLVVSRRVRSQRNEPFGRSLFFDEALHPARSDDDWTVRRARELAEQVLRVANTAPVPIRTEDVAFAMRFSIRSMDGIEDDLLGMRETIFAEPPPKIQIRSVRGESSRERDDGSAVAAIVRGRFSAADWRETNGRLARDPQSGAPIVVRRRNLDFVLALPQAARRGPVPVVFYQHGNPGNAIEEVLRYARRSLAAAGFAVIGFDDVLNREVSPSGAPAEVRASRQVVDMLARILATSDAPDHFAQTVAEQLTFIRAIERLAERGPFAIGRRKTPIAGIDPDEPLMYLGVSEGAHHGVVLLPFAPEIRAAALISPGRRFSEVLIHQRSEQLLSPLSFLGFGQLGPTDIWVTLALIQMVFDDQDPNNFARFLYREPLALGRPERASVLVVEGLGDSLVPNHATHSLLRELGPVVHLAPPDAPVAGLETARSQVSANVGAQTTAAFYQYVPQGIDGVDPTPGCGSPPLSSSSAREGHYCAQSASESVRQREHFFRSARGGPAPEIIDPLRGAAVNAQ